MKWLTSSENQKHLGLVVLAFIGLTTIYFGLKTIPGRLIKPFNLLPPGASGVDLNSEAKEQAKIAALKKQDTDNDGLMDYDELTLYRTSPFIEDSDSDGVSDKEEIEKGQDPNCPQGQDCRLALGNNFQEGQSAAELNLPQGSMANLEAEALAALPENFNLSPEEIRTVLKESGFSEEEIAKFDNQTLQQMWQEALKQSSGAANKAPASGEAAAAKTPTASELRQTLKETGLDPKILEKVSDEELMKMYGEIIKGQ